MSKRAEEAAWAWAVKNKLDPYSMGRAFGEGYEQAEKDYIELAQLWVGSGNVNIMGFKQFLKCHETQSNK